MLKAHRWIPGRYCQYIGVDPGQHWRWISDSETARFLYAFFFGWRCDKVIVGSQRPKHMIWVKNLSSMARGKLKDVQFSYWYLSMLSIKLICGKFLL